MSLILSVVVSFLISISTCFVFFQISKTQKAEVNTIQQTASIATESEEDDRFPQYHITSFEAKRNKIMQIFEKANCLVKGDLVNYLANRDISMNKLIGVCQKIILMKQLKDKDCMNLEIDDILLEIIK